MPRRRSSRRRASPASNAYGLGGPDAKRQTLEFLAGWQGFAGRNSEVFTLVDTAADLDRAKADGKCAVIMGIQNAEHFDTVADVALFRRLGLRCSQLTYNSQNRIGSGSTDRVDGGVSDYGAAIVAEMEKQKMLVDVSHCGDRTTLDARSEEHTSELQSLMRSSYAVF